MDRDFVLVHKNAKSEQEREPRTWSIIYIYLEKCLVNNVIVSGNVLKAQLYNNNNIQEGYYFCNNNY